MTSGQTLSIEMQLNEIRHRLEMLHAALFEVQNMLEKIATSMGIAPYG